MDDGDKRIIVQKTSTYSFGSPIQIVDLASQSCNLYISIVEGDSSLSINNFLPYNFDPRERGMHIWPGNYGRKAFFNEVCLSEDK